MQLPAAALPDAALADAALPDVAGLAVFAGVAGVAVIRTRQPAPGRS